MEVSSRSYVVCCGMVDKPELVNEGLYIYETISR